ncbi:nucleoside triphosphate pyrophosphohydrolase [Micromonospora noduli]|nr:nucleoside triphosphate pyrophosphohydrolase [Micromonospora noduli]
MARASRPAKLVRDKIPQLVRASGEEPITSIADDTEYRRLLRLKLREEVEEFVASDDVEELADVLEVVRALVVDLGTEFDTLEQIRDHKAANRGGFSQRIVWYGNRPKLT